ncbi:MAG TPA: CsgG/HfaB family protein [Cytophagaceae bacterium]
MSCRGILFVLLISVCSCTGSRYYARQGEKMEQLGMYDEAARFYLQSVQRNRDNIKGRVGLKTNGQKVLDDMLAEFYQAHAMEDHKKAVYSYLECQKYLEQVEYLQIKLNYPSYYKDYFEASKEIYLTEVYEKGNQSYQQQDYKTAESLFSEIIKIDKDFKNAKDLHRSTVIEPLYEEGQKALQSKDYRLAYDYFDQVIKKDRNYKDALDLREKARIESQVTIAVMPIQSAYSGEAGISAKLQAYVLEQLTNINSPFIRLVDRENTDRIIQEQKLGLSGVVDESTAAQAGKLLGVKAVLVGKIVEYNKGVNRLQRYKKQGYESYVVKVLDPATKTYRNEVRYRHITYDEYYQSNYINITYQYQLISSETGQILQSDIINLKDGDEVNYVTYSGDPRNLYPNKNGQVVTFGSEKSRLQQLCTSRRQLQPVEEFEDSLLKQAAKKVASRIKEADEKRGL